MKRLALSCTATLALAGGAWAQSTPHDDLSREDQARTVGHTGRSAPDFGYTAAIDPNGGEIATVVIGLDGFSGSENIITFDELGGVVPDPGPFSIADVTFSEMSSGTGGPGWRLLAFDFGGPPTGPILTDNAGISDIRIDFDTPQDRAGVFMGVGPATYELQAYDQSGNLLETTQVTVTETTEGAFAGFENFAGISRLRIIEPTGENGFVGGIDDLHYEQVDSCANCPCPEDINRDGVVDFADILRILAAWGPCDDCDDCEDGFVDRCGGTDDCLECQTPDGRCLCTFGALIGCGDFRLCDDGECPPGFFCCLNTCCPEPICMPLCEADVPEFERAQPGELTPTGIMRAAVPTFDLGAMMDLGPQRRGDLETAQVEFDYDDAGVGSPLAATGGPEALDLGEIVNAQSGVVILDSTFPGRGWFNDVGLHTASNDNTFTGTVNPDPQSGSGRGLNSFYVYDVSGLAGLEVISAAVRFQQDDYFSQDPSERIGVYDVSASRARLIADYPRNDAVGIAIHDDLQTGNRYGVFSATPGQGNVYNTGLSDAALADINAAIGGSGDFSIGLHNETDSMQRQDGVRFDMPTRVHQLILETRPGDPCDDCPCPEDINRDGVVDFADILRVLAAWGPCPGDCDDCEDGNVEICDERGECLDCITPDGDCLCAFGVNSSCSDWETCNDGRCPPGFFCCVNTCCPEPICLPLCEAAPAEFERAEPGELTPTGIMRAIPTFGRDTHQGPRAGQLP